MAQFGATRVCHARRPFGPSPGAAGRGRCAGFPVPVPNERSRSLARSFTLARAQCAATSEERVPVKKQVGQVRTPRGEQEERRGGGWIGREREREIPPWVITKSLLLLVVIGRGHPWRPESERERERERLYRSNERAVMVIN